MNKSVNRKGRFVGGGGGLHVNNMDYFYHAASDQSFTVGSGFLDHTAQNSDLSIYLKLSSVLFVRAGLFLSHVSSIPSSNIQTLIFQNIIDVAVNTVLYALLGYLFAFGEDVGTFIGGDGFLGDKSNRNEFAEGWLIIVAVSGLLVAAIGDRISFFASLLMNTLISGFVFPIIIHWILSDYGWMRVHTFTRVRVSYKDYSYSCLIHMSGGFLAFLSMLILNKRLLRFKDMDVCSIPDNGPSLTLFGNFCMLIGFFGIGTPTERYIVGHLNYNFYGIVLVNMLLSAFGAITSTLLLTFSCPCEPMHKWTSMRSIQAGISGIAVIAGGADVYSPLAALLLGLCNGLIFFFVSFLVNISPIEDYSNIIACHFASGLLGTLLPPIFGVREGFGSSAYFGFIHVLWQVLGDLAVLGFILVVFLPVTLLLDYCSILRSWDEDINHRRALFASKSIKNENGMTQLFDYQTTEQTPNFLESGIMDRSDIADEMSSPKENNIDAVQERVDVLFEKKPSPLPLKSIEEVDVQKDPAGDYLAASSFVEKTKKLTVNELHKFNDEKFIVNYMVQSQPMAFFEEVITDSRQCSDVAVKDCGDNLKNSKFFDIKPIKGMRNISDSKLFQKFKDNWTVPKRRSNWNRERELKFGSMSNIWVSNFSSIGLETQV